MKLYINSSDSEKIVVGLGNEIFETIAHEDKSQKLLGFIKKILTKKGKRIEDVSRIEVDTGPGSFTGLKVGVAIANAIGWSLNITVNGKDLRKGEIPDINYSQDLKAIDRI